MMKNLIIADLQEEVRILKNTLKNHEIVIRSIGKDLTILKEEYKCKAEQKEK